MTDKTSNIVSVYNKNFKNENLGSQITLNSILEFSHNSNFQNDYDSKYITQNTSNAKANLIAFGVFLDFLIFEIKFAVLGQYKTKI